MELSATRKDCDVANVDIVVANYCQWLAEQVNRVARSKIISEKFLKKMIPWGIELDLGCQQLSGVFFVFLVARFVCVCPRLAISICLESGSKDQLYQLSMSVYQI